MNLFEKVKEVKEYNEKANRLMKELKDNLLNQFVELPYEIKEVKVNYPSRAADDKDGMQKVYYPILDTPKEFKKEDEKFYREYINCINHEYTLIGEEGRIVTIQEHAMFENDVYSSKKAFMRLDFYIVENIEFNIKILGENYSLEKSFNLKELIKKIIGPDDVASFSSLKIYDEQRKKYNEFLKDLGRTRRVPTLKKLANADKTEFQITDSISAIAISSIKDKTKATVWLKSSMYRVQLDDIQEYSIDILIKPYFKETFELVSRHFQYEELENEEELRKGKNFDEIVQLLESYQTE